MTTPPLQRKRIILILGALSTVTPFAIDMYLPSLPTIAKDLNVDVSRVALSLSSYFIGLSFGQLLYGPLLDRFGRKPPLYAGLILFIIGSLGCMSTHSIEALIAFRFLQALGGCSASVASRAMVRDFFPVQESARIFAWLILILSVSPLLAPTVGSFVAVQWGWRSIFLALASIVALILGATYSWLPKARHADREVSLHPRLIGATYLTILKEPRFRIYTLSGAFGFAGLFVYVAGSPEIFLESFHLSTQSYGALFALLSVGFISGSQLNSFLLRRHSSERIYEVALIAQCLIGLGYVLGAWSGQLGLYGTVACQFAFLSCLGIGSPNASAIALAPFSRNAGSASAMLGFLQMGIGALVSAGVGFVSHPGYVPIVALMAMSAWVGLGVLWAGKRQRLRNGVLHENFLR